MSADDLLEELADGEFHTGQALSDRQGMSRHSLVKQLASLEAIGVDLQRRRGHGYRIPGGLDLLGNGKITARLTASARGYLGTLHIHHAIDSTNSQLQRQPWPESQRAAVCLGESQSAGRGRRGRHWVSPFAKNIYLSVAWTFKGGPDVAAGLPLAVGVVLCDALAGFGVAGLQLKWPNDLLFEQRKLAGILLEMSGDAAGPCRVVVGVGLNVMMPEAAADAIDQPWADLASAAGPAAPARNVLVAALLERLLPLLANYEATGFAPWRDRWQELDAFRDASVIAEQSGKRIAGTGAGVNDHGSLQLQTRSGLVSLHGGEVSLRRAS